LVAIWACGFAYSRAGWPGGPKNEAKNIGHLLDAWEDKRLLLVQRQEARSDRAMGPPGVCAGTLCCSKAWSMATFNLGRKQLRRPMRLQTIAFAAPMLLASATFTSSFAQTAAVSEKSFDWIFFVIVGIPLVLGLVALLRPNLLESFIREWPWEGRRASSDRGRTAIVEHRDGTPPL
jgi:hypothetical protein